MASERKQGWWEGLSKEERRVEMNRRKGRGKAAQKRLAKLVGGKDVGSLSGEDVYHQDWSFEQKNFEKSAVFGLMAQAVKNCCGRRPAVVVVQKGKRIDQDGLVIIRFADFKRFVLNQEVKCVKRATTT